MPTSGAQSYSLTNTDELKSLLKHALPGIPPGIFFGLAAIFSETVFGALCAWASIGCLVWLADKRQHFVSRCYTFGLVFHAVAFYWLVHTLEYFGGFPKWLAIILFLVFCFVSSIQLLFVAIVYNLLRHAERLKLFALPLAWFSAEMLFPRLFPWNISHTQAIWTSFATLAEYSGVYLLSGLMIFWGVVLFELVQAIRFRDRSLRLPLCISIVVSVALIAVGHLRTSEVARFVEQSPKVRVGLIQGNLEAKQKRDIHYLEANLEEYRRLSRKAVEEGAEILFWPESVMNSWLPGEAVDIRGSRYDPFPDQAVPLVYGGLSYRERSEQQLRELLESSAGSYVRKNLDEFRILPLNGAFSLNTEGRITGRYYKKILMPFGEYLPFSESFPQIRALSPQSGNFEAGSIDDPLRVALKDGRTISAAALICYEDLVPELSRNAVELGAQLLVNLTNDAWYGPTAAPTEHHLLALWRSIETRRYLLRVTNTGYTAVVDALGRTRESLPIFTSGYIVADVHLLDIETVYSRIGDIPGYALSSISLLIAGVIFFRRRSTSGV